MTGPDTAVPRALDWLRVVIGLASVVGILLAATGFSVPAGESAIVVRFGDPTRVIQEPGLYWKAPWPIDQVVSLDLRRRAFETGHAEMLTRDRKNVVLVGFAIWRVSDPLAFHRSIGSIDNAEDKLDGLLTNAQIGVLGRFDLQSLTSTNPSLLRTSEIEAELLAAVVDVARDQYGIEVLAVGFQRLSLPEDNVTAVFKQMRAERRQYAARYEAEGAEAAAKIRAETDLEAARIRASGTEEAARIKGEAEAEAARIYAEAHRQDPDLYRFVRSLDALDEVVGSDTTVILRTDSPPFRLLTSEGR
ncbi:MAG: protease modulator HflC [Phycisphaerae bacterium]|nr:protease modulator HflC [Phycisphaerae bacterium]